MRSRIPKRFSKKMAIEIALARCLLNGNVTAYRILKEQVCRDETLSEAEINAIVAGAIKRGDPLTIEQYANGRKLSEHEKKLLVKNTRHLTGRNVINALAKYTDASDAQLHQLRISGYKHIRRMSRPSLVALTPVEGLSSETARRQALSELDKPHKNVSEIISLIMSLSPAIFGKDPVHFLKTTWYQTTQNR